MQIKANSVNTHYQRIGKHKDILVLLHGWGCDWQIWHSVIFELSKKYTLVIPDLPAFGKTTPAKEIWNLYDYVAWLEEFINLVVKDQKFILLGHSFGGQIASVYAAQADDSNLKKLVLVDSAGLADSLSVPKKVQMAIFGIIPDKVKQLLSNNLRKKILELLNSSTDHLESNLYQRQVLKKVVHENIAKELIKIQIPTLLVWGKNDDATPLHMAEKFHNLIKNSRLEIFENSGHFPFIDEPIKFVNIIIKAD